MTAFPLHELVPAPRAIDVREGFLELSATRGVELVGAPPDDASRERIESALDEWGPAEGGQPLRVRTSCGRSEGLAGQAYELEVSSTGVTLRGAGRAGLHHAVATLRQLLRLAGEGRRLPCLRIDDAPAFERRGWMLDVSRDRIPTLATLFRLVDLLADLKGNELQLYMEHTFAYAGHEEVWRGTGALTPAEVRRLDDHCAARGVSLVPNQNCLGHLHHWLVHDRYRPLAEVPEGVEHPFADAKEPFSLCPTDPASLAFVEELLDQLLPCFRAREVNVGLDETFDIGLGRSERAVAERGGGRVYLDHLCAVNDRVRARGRRMQFWADVLLEHPDLVDDVPKDALALLWGYEASHPFDDHARRVAASGLPFVVCPGTSSWQSLAGRTANLLGNLDAAVRAGLAHGAEGVLITDWGDRGHLQPEWASYAGWTLGCALAWNPTPDVDPRDPAHLAVLLDRHVLLDGAGVLGALLLALGRAGERTGVHAPNASPLSLFVTAIHKPFPAEAIEGEPTVAGCEAAADAVRATVARLGAVRSRRADAELLAREVRWVADALVAAAGLGAARLGAGGALDRIAAPERAELAATFRRLAETHGALWLARCRAGGLERSVRWLDRVAEALTP